MSKIVKCVGCGAFVGDDEVVWTQYEDDTGLNREQPYCVNCSDDDALNYDDEPTYED